MRVYPPRLLEHFQNPRNVGELAGSALVVEVENPACGDVLRLSAEIEKGAIAEVRYKVRGCTASIACGSALTELLQGMRADELAGVDAARIAAAVGGLSSESRHAAVLCADAVAALLRLLP